MPTGKGGRDGDKSDEDGREQGEESTKGGLLGGILAGGARVASDLSIMPVMSTKTGFVWWVSRLVT